MKISKKAIEDIINRLYSIEQNGEMVIRPDLLDELIGVISGRYDNAGYSVEKTVGGERLIVYAVNKSVKKIFERKIGYDTKAANSNSKQVIAPTLKWPTKEIVTIIKEVQEQFGLELFQDRRRSVAVLSDVLAGYPEEAKIIKMIFNEGIFNVLGTVPLISEEDKKSAQLRVDRFLANLGISADVRQVLARTVTESFYQEKAMKACIVGKAEVGTIYFLAPENSKERKTCLYKMITQSKKGLGRLERIGFNTYVEALNSITDAYQYLMLNGSRIDKKTDFNSKDYKTTFYNCFDGQLSSKITIASLISMASSAMNMAPIDKLAVAGDMSSAGEVIAAEDLKECFTVCAQSGIKIILLPIYSAKDIGNVSAEYLGKCAVQFYSSPIDAIQRALGLV